MSGNYGVLSVANPMSAAQALTEPGTAPLVDCKDGFRPGDAGPETRAAQVLCHSPGLVAVLDSVLPRALAEQAYRFTCAQKAPWGGYVLKDDVIGQHGIDGALPSLEAGDDPIPLAIQMLRHVCGATGAARALFGAEAGSDRAHGFAFWALASPAGSEVPYHMDYAEQYRLETNIIHPPIMGATLQLSPIDDGDMQGGTFAVHTDGLRHYKRFGHQCRLASDDALRADMESSPGWIRVPYRFNRATVHDGSLPHLSTKVTTLPPGVKRVILGINLFDSEIGPRVQRVPIHSYAFKRTEKLAGVFRQLKDVADIDAKGQGIRLSDLRKFALEKGADHPMSKFLVAVAKAMKAKGINASDGAQAQDQDVTKPKSKLATYTDTDAGPAAALLDAEPRPPSDEMHE